MIDDDDGNDDDDDDSDDGDDDDCLNRITTKGLQKVSSI
jgi:hypothetical protein